MLHASWRNEPINCYALGNGYFLDWPIFLFQIGKITFGRVTCSPEIHHVKVILLPPSARFCCSRCCSCPEVRSAPHSQWYSTISKIKASKWSHFLDFPSPERRLVFLPMNTTLPLLMANLKPWLPHHLPPYLYTLQWSFFVTTNQARCAPITTVSSTVIVVFCLSCWMRKKLWFIRSHCAQPVFYAEIGKSSWLHACRLFLMENTKVFDNTI